MNAALYKLHGYFYVEARVRFAIVYAAVMLGLWTSGAAAAAADKACAAVAGVSSEELTGCTCGDALAQLPLSAPSGLRLVAACHP